MKLNKTGFTTLEIVAVLVIISILTVAGGFVATNVVSRSRIDATTADLQVFASDMEAILEDIGVVTLNPDEDSLEKRKSKIQEYLSMIEADYTHMTFNSSELIITDSNFTVSTLEARDPWGSPYTLIYNTDDVKGTPGTCILTSPGPNMILESEDYSSGEFKDDIMVIITPKG